MAAQPSNLVMIARNLTFSWFLTANAMCDRHSAKCCGKSVTMPCRLDHTNLEIIDHPKLLKPSGSVGFAGGPADHPHDPKLR